MQKPARKIAIPDALLGGEMLGLGLVGTIIVIVVVVWIIRRA